MLGGVGTDAPAVWSVAELQGIPPRAGRSVSATEKEGRTRHR